MADSHEDCQALLNIICTDSENIYLITILTDEFNRYQTKETKIVIM